MRTQGFKIEIASRDEIDQCWSQAISVATGLEYVHLDRDKREDDEAGIRLATMHRVKGLEFPHMFLVAINDRIIPYIYAGGEVLDEDEILQERCLLHVASSRARDTLTITSYGQASSLLENI